MSKTFVRFSLYRPNDYRIPRSRRDAYGWDAPLYVPSQPDRTRVLGWCLWIICIGLLIWRMAGWL